MGTVTGINPGRMKALAKAAGGVASHANAWHKSADALVKKYELGDHVGQTLSLCKEVAEELGLLDKLAASKAEQIENVAGGHWMSAALSGTDMYQQMLEESLGDYLGADFSDPKLASLLAELKANPNFTPEWYSERLNAAMEEGDVDKVRLLAAALWKRLGELGEANGRQFIATLDPKTGRPYVSRADLVVLYATAGVPEIQFLVSDFMAHTDAVPPFQFLDKHAKIVHQLGIDVMNPQSIAQMVADDLLAMSRRTPDGAALVLRAVKSAPARPWASPLSRMLLTVGNEHPNLVLKIAGGDAGWAQGFIDRAAETASEAELKRLMELVTAKVAQFHATDPSSRRANAQALAQLDRAMHQIGHGATLDYGAVLRLLGSSLPHLGQATSVLGAIDQMQGSDSVSASRSLQTDVTTRNTNLAMRVLALTDPGAADKILHAARTTSSADGNFSADHWNAIRISSGSDKSLSEAMAKLKGISDEMMKAYMAVEE